MSPELEKNMESIRSGRTSECLGCLARNIAIAYIIICDSDLEKAMLELLEHESPEAQYPAYVILCRCCNRLSDEAIAKINIYKENPCHKRILREAQKKDLVSLECITRSETIQLL